MSIRTSTWNPLTLPAALRAVTRSAAGNEGGEPLDIKGFQSGEAEGFAAFARHELERQHPHADEIGAVDPLEALRDHRAERLGELRQGVVVVAGSANGQDRPAFETVEAVS